MTLAVNIAQSGSNNVTFRNKIINGAQFVDQRGSASSAVNVTNQRPYATDRWCAEKDNTTGSLTIQQSTTAPSGFANSLYATVTTADSALAATDIVWIEQNIEGYNCADFAYGTASATAATLSFWVRSSLTGTYSIVLLNTYGYSANYTINSANTWEYKTIYISPNTFAANTSTTNGQGLKLRIALMAGSSYQLAPGTWTSGDYIGSTSQVNWMATVGNTFYITGVQLEAGSTASPFEYRQYGTELALCQRYYEKSFPIGTAPADNISTATGNTTQFIVTSYASTNYVSQNINFQVSKRAAPTMTYYANSAIVGTNGTAGQWRSYVGGSWVNATSTTSNQNTNTGFLVAGGGLTGGTTGQSYFSTGEWVASAEL
jgi:hypothetical protein